MKIYKYILFIVFCLLFGCSKKAIESDNLACKITVDENIPYEKILYSSLFDSLKYISLKTSEEVLIKEITKIKYYKDVIYILDKTIQTLFAFDLNGNLVWKIQNVEKGPKEYSQLADFDIDEKNNTLLLFSRFEKIQVYDLKGNLIEEWRTPFIGISFAANENRMYLYTGGRSNLVNNENGKYNLLFLQNKDILKGDIPYKKELPSVMIYNSPNAFYKYDSEIRFFMPFSNNIYSIKEDSVYVKYLFNFGKYNLPDDYFNNHTPDDLPESGYAYGLNSYWENQKYCYFHIFNIASDKRSGEILYFKNEGKAVKGSFYDDMAYCFPIFFQATDDYIIGARCAEDLFMEYNHSKNARKATMLEKIISEISEDDNPVIFFCYLNKR